LTVGRRVADTLRGLKEQPMNRDGDRGGDHGSQICVSLG